MNKTVVRQGKTLYIGSTFKDSSYVTEDNECKSIRNRIVYVMTERTETVDGQILLEADIVLKMYWTNLGESDQEIIDLYHNHAVCEQFHSEIKSDMGVERLPSGKFDTKFLAGLLHDMGKYKEEYRSYLEAQVFGTGGPAKGSVVHTFAAVRFLLERYHHPLSEDDTEQAMENLTAELLAFATGAHHGLFDCVNENAALVSCAGRTATRDIPKPRSTFYNSVQAVRSWTRCFRLLRKRWRC